MTGIIDVIVPCKSAEIKEQKDGTVEVTLSYPEAGDILDLFEPDEIASHFDHKKLLDEIDEETARKHYGFPEDDGSDEIDRLQEEVKSLEKEVDDLKEQLEKANSKDYIDFEDKKLP